MEVRKIVFAGGCFWCTEAVFQRLNGVNKVTSGYANGEGISPSYEDVVAGVGNFAEAVEIEYNPKIISLDKLLEIFWATHDPTSLNQQGADKGIQYRSAVYYTDAKEKKIIENSKNKQKYSKQIVTLIEPLKNFYSAEEYHQNYYNQNKNSNMYCLLVINPKIEKLLEKFNSEVKKQYK